MLIHNKNQSITCYEGILAMFLPLRAWRAGSHRFRNQAEQKGEIGNNQKGEYPLTTSNGENHELLSTTPGFVGDAHFGSNIATPGKSASNCLKLYCIFRRFLRLKTLALSPLIAGLVLFLLVLRQPSFARWRLIPFVAVGLSFLRMCSGPTLPSSPLGFGGL